MPGNIKGHPLAFPIIINSSDTTFFDIPSLANETLSIYWSWDKLDKYTPSPLRDQLIIPKGDTLDYLISN